MKDYIDVDGVPQFFTDNRVCIVDYPEVKSIIETGTSILKTIIKSLGNSDIKINLHGEKY